MITVPEWDADFWSGPSRYLTTPQAHLESSVLSYQFSVPSQFRFRPY